MRSGEISHALASNSALHRQAGQSLSRDIAPRGRGAAIIPQSQHASAVAS
jgi:hypothetical protein